MEYELTQEELLIEEAVLDYLKKFKKYCSHAYNKLLIWGVRPNNIIRFIENNQKEVLMNYDFIIQIESAIKKIYEHNIIPFPKIESQQEEDKLLAKVIRNGHEIMFGKSNFFRMEVTKEQVAKYLERNEEIHDWNADFVIKVQNEVERAKLFLLKD